MRKKKHPKRNLEAGLPVSMQGQKCKILDFIDAPDELKISSKLIEMMEPFADEFEPLVLLDCASIAWNACVDDNPGRLAVLNCAFVDYSKYSKLIETLKQRKRALFPRDLRRILKAWVVSRESGDVLQVTAEFPPEHVMKAMESLANERTPEDVSEEFFDKIYDHF